MVRSITIAALSVLRALSLSRLISLLCYDRAFSGGCWPMLDDKIVDRSIQMITSTTLRPQKRELPKGSAAVGSLDRFNSSTKAERESEPLTERLIDQL